MINNLGLSYLFYYAVTFLSRERVGLLMYCGSVPSPPLSLGGDIPNHLLSL